MNNARMASPQSILQQPVAKLSDHPILGNIPWGHHVLLMGKIKDKTIRLWYMEQTIANGWSRDTLASMIKKEIKAELSRNKGGGG